MKNSDLKIADYDRISILTGTSKKFTPEYLAPEVLTGNSSNLKSDVWWLSNFLILFSEINIFYFIRALGVSFYQICTKYVPFIANNIIGVQHIINKPTPDLPDEFNEYNYLFKKYRSSLLKILY